MPEIYEPITITVTTEATAVKTGFLDKKHVLIEANRTNQGKIYVAVSYDFTGRKTTAFEPLNPSEPRFYGAPEQKAITYIWYYADTSGDGFTFVASDGALARPAYRRNRRQIALYNGTALKATAWATIVSVTGEGELRAIGWVDPDDLTQNEHLRVTIDDVVLFTVASGVPNYTEYLNLVAIMLDQSYIGMDKAAMPLVPPFPFTRNLKVEYYRDAAGTTGLSIRVLYEGEV